MSRNPWSLTRQAVGFTLIEVVGALVIFSVGVLMVLRLSTALGIQMRYSGARSELVVLASERLDSLEATPFDSIGAGTTQDTLTVEGMAYERTVTITAVTAVLSKIDVSLVSIGGEGPSHAVTSYTSAAW